MRKRSSYRLALFMLGAALVTGCAGAKETELAATTETTTATLAMSDVLPQAGEAQVEIADSDSTKEDARNEVADDKIEETTDTTTETTENEEVGATENKETDSSKKNNKKANKGSITVATVGSPNTEILQQAAVLLEEKGYVLKVEVCEDYLTPNQMLVDGKADCNYYQHKAFLERYNIEHQSALMEVAKIHYEPLTIYSKKIDKLEQVTKGMKVAISNNPTAIARALWLLQDLELVTLMSDADMNTVKDDIAENPFDLEFAFVEESELVAQLDSADLVVCDKDLLMQEAIDDEELVLAIEKQDTMMVQELSQIVVASDAANQKAQILTEVLLSDEMKQFVVTKYQGSIVVIEEAEESVE